VRISAVVPHLKPFGGVRRFLEIGNVFAARGHEFRAWTLGGEKDIKWFDYKGQLEHWVNLSSRHGITPGEQIVLIGDPLSFKYFKDFPNAVSYVYVIAGGEYLPQYQKLYGEHPFLLNNRVFLTEFPEGRLVEGGVNSLHFRRKRPFRVGYYAGRGRIKGEQEIIDQLSDLRAVDLVGISGFSNDQIAKVYSCLDYFVVWESRPGWSNTAAEALASGVPVVTNGTNCEPFLDRCIVVDSLREFFMSPMKDLSWESVVDRLIEIWQEDGVWQN